MKKSGAWRKIPNLKVEDNNVYCKGYKKPRLFEDDIETHSKCQKLADNIGFDTTAYSRNKRCYAWDGGCDCECDESWPGWNHKTSRFYERELY